MVSSHSCQQSHITFTSRIAGFEVANLELTGFRHRIPCQTGGFDIAGPKGSIYIHPFGRPGIWQNTCMHNCSYVTVSVSTLTFDRRFYRIRCVMRLTCYRCVVRARMVSKHSTEGKEIQRFNEQGIWHCYQRDLLVVSASDNCQFQFARYPISQRIIFFDLAKNRETS